jgi:hypothetical protein
MSPASQVFANLADAARGVSTHRITGQSGAYVAINRQEFDRLMSALAEAAEALARRET